MDSPVRIQLKKNDYLRHKFFRTLNRRKKRLLLQLIEAPEKELRRRLRLKKYEGGKSPMDYEYRGTVYDDELKNQGITHVAELPEVVVSGRDYTKPYESAFEYDPNFAKELPYLLPVVGDALDAVDVARDVYNGDYLSAGIGAGMLALPNLIEKPAKGVGKIIRRTTEWTPEQWTAAQDAAIAMGNMAEAQRLRDLHFKVSAPNTKVIDENGNPLMMYHGTDPEGDYILRHNGVQYKPNGLNMFFTSNYYGQYLGGTKTKSVPLYINATKIGLPGNHYEIGRENPLKYLKKDQDALYEWGFLKNNDFATDEAFESAQNTILPKEISWAKSKGFDLDLDNIDKLDAPRFLKAVEEDINTRGVGHHPVEEFAVPKGEQVKLADAVTYDDNGVRIPLGERDNFNLNDIRYGLLPFGIGLSAYGATNSNNGTTVYSKGKDSGIHIKPENRGKFNALKKRTGKTTEELTHSKNPLTRKRAIFALNARKWNHKK